MIMDERELRLECLRLANAMRTDVGYVGNAIGMMAQGTLPANAAQIRDRAQVFYDFVTGRPGEPAPTPVKVGDKLIVVGG
jgi:hypothetical protein